MKIEVVAHELPDLTPEQLKQQEEPRRPQGHRHGKPHSHKAGAHKPGAHGGHRDGTAPTGDNPHAPKKRNGSRPHWQRGKDKARSSAA